MTILVGARQFSAEIGEHLGKGRNDEDQDDADDDNGDGHDRRRIHHGALDLLLQLHGLFRVGGETVQDGVQDTAHLAGRHQVHEQLIEYGRVLRQGVGKGGTALHALLHLQEHILEGPVLLLAGKDLQALDQGKAGVYHGGELAGEDDDLLGRHLLSAETGELQLHRHAFPFLLDGDAAEPVLLQLRFDHRLARGLHDTFLGRTGSAPSLPLEFRHCIPPSLSETLHCAEFSNRSTNNQHLEYACPVNLML